MKLTITEKQLELVLSDLLSDEDLKEQETTSTSGDATPKAGTSSTGSKQGYPEVGKWESGVSRGPANQIGVTKWSDVVGSVLKRGKANPLK